MKRYLALALAVVALAIVAAGCGGGSSAACTPPNTQSSGDFEAVTDGIEAFVKEKAQGVVLTKADREVGMYVTYQVAFAAYDSATVALNVQVDIGFDGPFGAYLKRAEKAPSYNLVFTRDCAGDDFELTSVEQVKPATAQDKVLTKIVSDRAKVVYGS